MSLDLALRSALASLAALALGFPAAPPPSNAPPVIEIELPPNPGWFLETKDLVRIRVRVTDPDGDRVSARLDATPTWQGFRPIVDEPSGATREIVWHLWQAGSGDHPLVVRAWDDFDPGRQVVAREPLPVLGAGSAQRALFRDFDGDGREELIAGVRTGDVGGVVDCGAMALFDRFGMFGAGPPPTLLVGAPTATSQAIGGRDHSTTALADVTGDGVDDLIASGAQAIYVWSAPGPTNARVPATATLSGSDPAAGFVSTAQSFVVADVTNDGILDVVAAASTADVGVVDAGEVCIFAGGPGLVGNPAPIALLRRPGAVAGDCLGSLAIGGSWPFDHTQALFVADVSGDSIPDVVVGAACADRGATADVGMVFVWQGGAALAGTPAPLATLDALASKAYDRIGVAPGEGIRLVDLTGDGVLDLLVRGVNVGSGGSFFLWHGGATLVGARDADARLRNGAPTPDDAIGLVWGGDGVYFDDFDGDGILDLLAGAVLADVAGVKDAGALFVWRGGSQLSGLVFETAQLRRTTPVAFDHLVSAAGGLQLVDVTGDGRRDVVVVSPYAAGSATTSGVIDVWTCGTAGFAGTVFPSAELQVPGAAASDFLGSCGDSVGRDACGVVCADVTGDAIADVVAVASLADVAGFSDAGRGWVWAGGPALAGGGVVAPTATLDDPLPAKGGLFGLHRDFGCAIQCGDVTGDGVLDAVLLVPADESTQPPSKDFARLLVFAGGAAMTGSPAPAIAAEAQQQYADMGLYGDDVALVDFDGDAITDVVAHAASFDPVVQPGSRNTGAVLLFSGGGSGVVAPRVLQSSTSVGGNGYDGVPLTPRDLDGDGRVDFALVQSDADVGSWSSVGQVLLWRSASRVVGRGGGSGSRTRLGGTVPPPPPPPFPGSAATEPEIATTADHLGEYCRLGE